MQINLTKLIKILFLKLNTVYNADRYLFSFVGNTALHLAAMLGRKGMNMSKYFIVL